MMKLIENLNAVFARAVPSVPGMTADTAADANFLLSEYLRQIAQTRQPNLTKPDEMEAGRIILEASPRIQAGVVYDAFQMVGKKGELIGYVLAQSLVSRLLRRHLPFTDSAVCQLINIATGRFDFDAQLALVRAGGRLAERQALSDDLRAALKAMRDTHEANHRTALRLRGAIDELLGAAPPIIHSGEPWGEALLADLDTMTAAHRAAWEALLGHCASNDSAKPSQKWLAEAKRLVEAVGEKTVQTQLRAWFTAFARTVPPLLAEMQSRPDYQELERLASLVGRNAVTLRGLVWCCRFFDDVMVPDLGDLATAAYKKITLHGPSSSKVGNACIQTLGALDDPAAVTQISRLRLKIPYRVAQSLIGKTLIESAARLGVTQDDLKEMSLPTHGLDEHGIVRHAFGGAIGEIAVAGMQTTLRWLDNTGKVLKSIPASVKREHATEIKTLQATRAEIEKTLLAQRDQLEGFYLNARDWSLEVWRERYVEHPLMGQIARRLIWQFQTQDGIVLGLWRGDRIEDAQGGVLEIGDAATVSLWHPLESSPETVLAWRLRLESLNLVQPFKQAHREVYLLTDAERATGTYSNRFAAHIIKQHQFHALCRLRGWKYDYQGRWDSHNIPTRELPQHGLRVEFFVNPTQEDRISEAYVYLYLATDQVRFIGTDRGGAALHEVPPLVFSEMMRDVDLFVGVGSVGNDPAWQDGGEQAWGRAYWNDFAFGDLGATAQTRRSVLERLLPRLKIAARCTLDGKFLIVRGNVRTYKIHLGSGNILMEPNDQYLCIVPGRSVGEDAKETLYLPFEGDRTLSIILSKAFLLADDTAIKDPAIVRQIER